MQLVYQLSQWFGPVPGSGRSHTQVQTGRRMDRISPGRKDMGVLVDEKLNMTQHVNLQLRKPTTFWAASKAEWPSG